MTVVLRKTQIVVEETFHEGGPAREQPRQVGSIACVIENPFSGKYVEDIAFFMEELQPLGLQAAGQLLSAMGGDSSQIDGYGKGVIVGAGGEREHGALWHVPGGYAMRELLGDTRAIVSSTKKVGSVGTRIDIPITHTNAAYVRSHFDAIEVGISDSPQVDEIALILVMSCGPRVHARVGGLQSQDIKGEDGLR